ncbi:MAG: hypothetical protein DI535_17870 [Citrobacter freundii]|nr:MAG: hypothetical protein DI535_17870 [Citrobacter freundii]
MKFVYRPLVILVIILKYYSSFCQTVQLSDSGGISVYLTFDDGPRVESHYLDSVIWKDSIPLSVFLIGARVVATKEMQQRLVLYKSQPLFSIGNHSYTHASDHYRLYYAAPEKVVEDITRNEDTLHLSGRIARLPGRNTWRISGRRRTDLPDAGPAADSLEKLGYAVVGWDLEWRFDTSLCRYYSAAEMADHIKQVVRMKSSFEKNHIVVLCHDWALTDEFFRQQLFRFIADIRTSKAIKFARISVYPGIHRGFD